MFFFSSTRRHTRSLRDWSSDVCSSDLYVTGVQTCALPIFEGTMVHAGPHLHEKSHPLHTHSFFEIALITGGEGVHHSLAGRQQLQIGDVILLRPGVWHQYDECRGLQVYNCCFSADLVQRELAWTREDPLLGYLLWTGPFSAQ